MPSVGFLGNSTGSKFKDSAAFPATSSATVGGSEGVRRRNDDVT